MSTSILVRLAAALAAALLLTSCATEGDPSPVFEEPSAALIHDEQNDAYVHRVEIICTMTGGGGITIGGCGTPERCTRPDPGHLYTLYRAPRDTPDKWEPHGTVCLSSPDELQPTSHH